jgi:phage pi2 protein 07
MTVKKIAKLLKQALLEEEKMEYVLYERELAEFVDDLKTSMASDKDDYIFTMTENRGHVAMLLIEKSGVVYINEQARKRLQTLWPVAYESNMKQFIPDFAQQLFEGELPINGVKVSL